MGRGPAVGVDDDLAAGETGVPVRPADHEGARRVHVPDGVLREPAVGQDLADVGLHDGADVGRGLAFVGVLVADDDLRDLDRLAVLVADRELALGVGAKRRFRTGLPRLGEAAEDRMGVLDRRRHELGRLHRGVAEHDALVARAFVLRLGRVHALRDVRGLAVKEVRDLAMRVMELLLRVADVGDAVARDCLDAAHEVVQLLGGGKAHLSADHHPVGRREGLAGDASLGFLGEESVEHGVGDAVADLVGVALGDGFRGEDVILAGHERCSIRDTPPRQEAVVTVGCAPICGAGRRVNAKRGGGGKRPPALQQ